MNVGLRQAAQIACEAVDATSRKIGATYAIEGKDQPHFKNFLVSLAHLILLPSRGRPPDSLPYLPLELAEADRLWRRRLPFGCSTRFGLEPKTHCTQAYITDAEHKDMFVVLSSLVWVAALATKAGLPTPNGAAWPRLSNKHQKCWMKHHKISRSSSARSRTATKRPFSSCSISEAAMRVSCV